MTRIVRRSDTDGLRATSSTRSPSATKPQGRVCALCPTILSVYNPGKLCGPCHSRELLGYVNAGHHACAYCGGPVYTKRLTYCSTKCVGRARAAEYARKRAG